MKRYIAIDMIAIKENGLTIEEWILLENIYFLSNNDTGYCFASKEKLREYIGVSNGKIYSIINSLIDRKFIIKNVEFNGIKTTEKWHKISSGDTLQNLENNPPKNGDLTIKYEYKGGVPTENQVIEAGKHLKLSEETCKNFYLYYSAKKWKGILDFVPLLRKWGMNENKTEKNEKVRLWG